LSTYKQKKFNGVFTKIASFQKSEKTTQNLSLLTNEDGSKQFVINTEWMTKDGKKARSKSQTIKLDYARKLAQLIIAEVDKIEKGV
jgi:hypothetical protein